MPDYEDVYEPPMLDETGQDMAAAIRELKSVIQPTNVCVDLDVSLEVSGWSNSAPYVYNWMNNKVTTECAVKVNYLEGAEDTDDLYIGYEKIVGGIQFESPTKPTAAIPVRIHIVNAEADSITNIDDEMVSSNVISGASNVKQALTSLKNADASLSEQIETLNSKITPVTIEDVSFSYYTNGRYIGSPSNNGIIIQVLDRNYLALLNHNNQCYLYSRPSGNEVQLSEFTQVTSGTYTLKCAVLR